MEGKRISSVGDMGCAILCSPVSHLGDSDLQLELDGMTISPGGNTLNFSLAAAAFGAQVSFYGAIGDDPFGSLLRRWMEKLGVKDHSIRTKGFQTSTTIAIPNLSGERRLLTHPGANCKFFIPPEKLDLDWSSHVHCGGFWFTKKMADGGIEEIFRKCREEDIQTSLDPASPPFGFRGKLAKRFEDTLPFVDILFVNTDQLNKLTGTRDISKGASRILDKGVGLVVVHRGERGSALIDIEGRKNLSAYHVLVPKNPTGCGDVFNGVFIAALMEGRTKEEAAEHGMAAATLHLGSSEPLYPDRIMVRERMSRGK
jgi:ribokinase